MLGTVEVPANAYWGVHTSRALDNFPITGVPVGQFGDLVVALVMVKQAAARANRRLGNLDTTKAEAIEAACNSIILEGRYHHQFVVDVVQGGAGTSTNMNTNEVIANVALSWMGRPLGDYVSLHPNDDVNMSQSTNDAYPTALRLALAAAADPLCEALHQLACAFKAKAVEFADILKIGRTQLQDAVPMTLGQEFDAFSATINEDVSRLKDVKAQLYEVNLGATAIGTGLNAAPRYAALAIEELARISGRPLRQASNLIEATSDMGTFVIFSGMLKRIAVKLSKIASDLRLLSSGPRAGFGEIQLPAVQAGSSIMPGKVNPVIPEVVNQVAYMVVGNDLTITMCAEGGQLQLNAFEPAISYCLLSSLSQLTAAVNTFRTRCVDGIEANSEHCRFLAETSIGLVTALVPVLGYEASSHIARRALLERRSIRDIILEEKLILEKDLDQIMLVERMISPNNSIS